jgi:hypothetical protein
MILRFVSVAALFALCACAGPELGVTRSFAVGQTFDAFPEAPGDAKRQGFDIRSKVIAVNGQLELCGAMIVTDHDNRLQFLRMLRGAQLVVDGRPVLRDLSYFNTRAKSFAPFTTDLANCRAIGMAIPTRPIKTELRIDAHLYRFSD